MPETFGESARPFAKMGAWRPPTELQKAAIGGPFCGMRPAEIGAMYADHLLLATHTYVAVAFGGMRLPGYSGRGGLAPWQVRCATELMIAKLAEDMSLSEPARACGLSLSYFSRAFRRSVGTPPHRWLLLQRMLRAKSLLRDADWSLADIAAACGFADQSHFTRVFAGVVGASPGA